MEKKQIVLYLGYSALILLALYFASGLLKIGGEGLASLGYSGDSLKEGFGDDDDDKKQKAREKMEKKLEGIVETLDSESVTNSLNQSREIVDEIEGMSDYQSIVDFVRDHADLQLRMLIANTMEKSKGLTITPAQKKEIIEGYQFIKALDMVGSGGGGAGAAKKAAGGFF